MNRILAFDYRAHDSFVAPARQRPQIWRLLFGLVLIAAIYVALTQAVFSTIFQIAGSDADALFEEVNTGSTPRGMYLLLFQFGLLGAATVFACFSLHKRGLASLFGGAAARRQGILVLAGMILLYAVIWALPPYGGAERLEFGISIGLWLVLLPLSLLAIFVQASTEEILFRGYLQQQLAARFRSPLIWIVLPSVLFGFGHYMPEMAGENALMISVWAAIFGLVTADLTARSGTLGPAIAVHFINNVSALLFMSQPDDMNGLALYITPFSLSDTESVRPWLWVDFGIMLVSWLTARLVLRR
ncbi:MAG: CPBP family intramembrane glutamic endopeptidase [Pseudomonadota bacterium]